MRFRDLFDGDFNPKWDEIAKMPAFAALKSTPHSKRWHKEGDPFVHTQLVTDAMLKYLRENENYRGDKEFYWTKMLAAAVCHDIGKARTTYYDKEVDDYRCKRHGGEGCKIVRKLFRDEDVSLLVPVSYLVRNHMALHHLADKTDENDVMLTLMRLSNGPVTLADMMILYSCDVAGSVNDDTMEVRMSRKAAITRYINDFGGLFTKYHFDSRLDRRAAAVAKRHDDYIARKCSNSSHVHENSVDGVNMHVNVLIGVPGSGKSTFAKTLEQFGPILSRDAIRAEMGLTGDKPQGNHSQENEVTRRFFDKLRQFSKVGMSFTIDNTNVYSKYRLEYLEYLKSLTGCTVRYYYFDTPLETCIERRKGQMPTKVIRRMWEDMEFPTFDEFDTLTIISTVDCLPTKSVHGVFGADYEDGTTRATSTVGQYGERKDCGLLFNDGSSITRVFNVIDNEEQENDER